MRAGPQVSVPDVGPSAASAASGESGEVLAGPAGIGLAGAWEDGSGIGGARSAGTAVVPAGITPEGEGDGRSGAGD